MQAREFLLAACAGILLWPAAAEAQSVRITLTEALARAREQAPRVVSARLSVEEARGRLVGASTRFQNNPELDVAVGRRRGDTSSTDVEFGIQQMLEPSGRRSARTDAARARLNGSVGEAGGLAIMGDYSRMRDAGLQMATFCASGAHVLKYAARRFSKITIFASA